MSRPIRLGLGPNLGQLALLVVVNAFLGATVRLKRSILPELAEGIVRRGRSLEARDASEGGGLMKTLLVPNDGLAPGGGSDESRTRATRRGRGAVPCISA
jgi:hypothetical protein